MKRKLVGMEPQRTQGRLIIGKRKALCSQEKYPLSVLTKEINSCCIEVHSNLGPGLLEGIYEEALAHEFKLRKINYEKQNNKIRCRSGGSDRCIIGIRISWRTERGNRRLGRCN